MRIDLQHFAQQTSSETGLLFDASTGIDSNGHRWYLLQPKGEFANRAFGIRTTLEWRRLRISFEPDRFASGLLSDMANADETGRAAFRSVLYDCKRWGAEIDFRINDMPVEIDDREIWDQSWRRFRFSLSVLKLNLDVEERGTLLENMRIWIRRFTAAIIAILPLENDEQNCQEDVQVYPEGAMSTVRINRHERDRRNRAAAISIHGIRCHACDLDFGTHYGQIAAGFIEIHHIVPVSQIGTDYVIDPKNDLVPLCPNCHSVAHRRQPPLEVSEIREMIGRSQRKMLN